MHAYWKYAACLSAGLMWMPVQAQPIGGANAPAKTTPAGTSGQDNTGSTGTAAPQPPSGGEKDENVDAATELFKAGKEEEALKKLQEAASKNDRLPPARLMLHRMYLSANRQADARRAIELAAVENPDHPDIYITFAMQAFAQNRYTDAWLQYERALKTMDDTKRWNEKQRNSVLLACYSGLGQTAEARLQYEVARKHYENILKLDFPRKDLSGFRAGLGRVLFMLDKKDEALKVLQEANADNPDMEPAGVLMARLYTNKALQERDQTKQREHINKAKEWFEYALKTDPKNHKAHISYAVWLFDMNYLDKSYLALSEEELKEANKLDPKAYDNRVLRGLIDRWTNNHEAAEQAFESVYKEKPDDFYAQNQLVLALVEQKGNPAKMQRALQLAEDNFRKHGQRIPEASATYGWVLFKNNRLDEAERALQISFQSGQFNADALYYLSQVYRYRGKLTEAADALRMATSQPGRFMYRK
ncbi:MAG TPA: tetratricopeptide repeat protein, partial [Gemmatales bacterium]|nr:tetratricopeptide repeat protein [Gemmatales bacterium]